CQCSYTPSLASQLHSFSFLSPARPHPYLHLFPYTTLFRSKVTNPILFFANAIPRNMNQVDISDINEQYLQEFLTGLQAAINQMSDRKSTRLNSSHVSISYAVFCLKKKKIKETQTHA